MSLGFIIRGRRRAGFESNRLRLSTFLRCDTPNVHLQVQKREAAGFWNIDASFLMQARFCSQKFGCARSPIKPGAYPVGFLGKIAVLFTSLKTEINQYACYTFSELSDTSRRLLTCVSDHKQIDPISLAAKQKTVCYDERSPHSCSKWIRNMQRYIALGSAPIFCSSPYMADATRSA